MSVEPNVEHTPSLGMADGHLREAMRWMKDHLSYHTPTDMEVIRKFRHQLNALEGQFEQLEAHALTYTHGHLPHADRWKAAFHLAGLVVAVRYVRENHSELSLHQALDLVKAYRDNLYAFAPNAPTTT